ncbi:hypothetical protein K3H47_05005 [Aeromonas veronii]|uniref:hypothetical protein n=1 Tax=Aeromonas veronii TaxID=654 RepID=UPI001F160B25|nr:hypothetical protein [Aeromonas veronii]MCF5763313.1 hypothetical protein [Aeromonas veronii]
MRPYIFIFTLMMPLLFAPSASSAALADFYIPAEVKSVHSYVSADSTHIKVNTIVKGFASNDPYFPKTVSVPKVGFFQFARSSMGSLVKTNAWWLAFSIAAGYMMTDDGPVITGNYYDASKYFDRGTCGSLTNATLSDCEARLVSSQGTEFKGWVSPGWYQCTGSTYISGFCSGINPLSFYRQANINGSTGYAATMLFPAGTQLNPPTVPVPQTKFENDFLTVCASNPRDCAKAFTDPNGLPYPNIFPPLKYLPNVNPADEPFLNCYFSGQLQTSNPSGACYATQETYDRIVKLAQDLIKGQTPEGQADAANQAAKNPLTQPQLEETLTKRDAAEAKADQALKTGAEAALAPAQSALDKLAEENTWLEQQITDSSKIQPPTSGLSLPQWVWPTGQCKPFPITFTVSKMSAKADDKGAFCTAYNDVAHPLIYWFIYMLTAVYIYVLWSRTMLQIVGGR